MIIHFVACLCNRAAGVPIKHNLLIHNFYITVMPHLFMMTSTPNTNTYL